MLALDVHRGVHGALGLAQGEWIGLGVVLGLGLRRRWGYALITLLFAAPWLDFAGMWLTKLASSQFAVLTVVGGWAMGLGYTIVTGIALWHMWRPTPGGVG